MKVNVSQVGTLRCGVRDRGSTLIKHSTDGAARRPYQLARSVPTKWLWRSPAKTRGCSH